MKRSSRGHVHDVSALAALDHLLAENATTVHLIAEASRRAAIDRDRYLGDTTRLPYRDLFSAARAAQWRASINPTRVTPTVSLTEPASTIDP